MKRTLREEYEICQLRGHEADYSITANVTIHHCKWCGCGFRTEHTLIETSVPEEAE